MSQTWEFVRTQWPVLPPSPDWFRCGVKVNNTLNSDSYKLLFINGGEDGLYPRKYFFDSDVADNCRLFKHCKNHTEFVIFRPIVNKVFKLLVNEVIGDKAIIKILHAFSGAEAGDACAYMDWTMADFRNVVMDHLCDSPNAILKFVSDDGLKVINLNLKVKSLIQAQSSPAEPASKKRRSA